jgi:hypothetical protein
MLQHAPTGTLSEEVFGALERHRLDCRKAYDSSIHVGVLHRCFSSSVNQPVTKRQSTSS